MQQTIVAFFIYTYLVDSWPVIFSFIVSFSLNVKNLFIFLKYLEIIACFWHILVIAHLLVDYIEHLVLMLFSLILDLDAIFSFPIDVDWHAVVILSDLF